MTMMRCEEMPRQLPRPFHSLLSSPLPIAVQPPTTSVPTVLDQRFFFVLPFFRISERSWSLSQRFRPATWSSRSLVIVIVPRRRQFAYLPSLRHPCAGNADRNERPTTSVQEFVASDSVGTISPRSPNHQIIKK